jgi:hypothetical protein
MMKPETEQLLADTIDELFHSESYRATREAIFWMLPESDNKPTDDLDTLLDRIDSFEFSMPELLYYVYIF